MLKTTINKYNGLIIDHNFLPTSMDEFNQMLVDLIADSINYELIWIKIPIEKSKYISTLAKHNFEFHHCDEKNLTLTRKVRENSFIPATKNFIVGVGAVVFNKGKLLVIKDRFSSGYKVPGGHIEKGETIRDALVREVMEETGVKIEFESILNLGHFQNGQFGESNIYIVCTAKALSNKIHVYDTEEILEAKWIDPYEFIATDDINLYNKKVVQAALENKDLKLQHLQIELKAPGSEVYF